MSNDDDAQLAAHCERYRTLYMVWYESRHGGTFSNDMGPGLDYARRNAGWFTEDGYPARIVELTVVDGQPAARWVD